MANAGARDSIAKQASFRIPRPNISIQPMNPAFMLPGLISARMILVIAPSTTESSIIFGARSLIQSKTFRGS